MHLQKLMEYINSDEFGFMNTTQAILLKGWMDKQVQAIQQQQAMVMALQQQAGQQQGGGGGGGGKQAPGAQPLDIGPGANSPVGPNQKLDETVGVNDRTAGMQ